MICSASNPRPVPPTAAAAAAAATAAAASRTAAGTRGRLISLRIAHPRRFGFGLVDGLWLVDGRHEPKNDIMALRAPSSTFAMYFQVSVAMRRAAPHRAAPRAAPWKQGAERPIRVQMQPRCSALAVARAISQSVPHARCVPRCRPKEAYGACARCSQHRVLSNPPETGPWLACASPAASRPDWCLLRPLRTGLTAVGRDLFLEAMLTILPPADRAPE